MSFVCVRHGAVVKVYRCTHPSGCKNQVGRGGVCWIHGGKFLLKPKCATDGCTNFARRGNGLCHDHGGKRACVQEGCNEPVNESGLCIAHAVHLTEAIYEEEALCLRGGDDKDDNSIPLGMHHKTPPRQPGVPGLGSTPARRPAGREGTPARPGIDVGNLDQVVELIRTGQFDRSGDDEMREAEELLDELGPLEEGETPLLPPPEEQQEQILLEGQQRQQRQRQRRLPSLPMPDSDGATQNTTILEGMEFVISGECMVQGGNDAVKRTISAFGGSVKEGLSTENGEYYYSYVHSGTSIIIFHE